MTGEERLTLKSLKESMMESFTKLDSSINNINIDLTEMKDKIIQNLIESNKNLQKKVENLQNELKKKESAIEANNQYGRRNNIEISGISEEINDGKLEETVVDLLRKIDIDVTTNDIEACHRLPLPQRNSDGIRKTIVRFVNRKHAEKSLKSKKKAHKIHNSLYISENLNKFYQKIAWHCRQLKREELISSFVFRNESFVIKIENEGTKRISHEDELFIMFPGYFTKVVDNSLNKI